MSQKKLDPDFIPKMRVAGRLAAATLEMITPYVQAGITTNTLNERCEAYMREHGAIPAPLTKGFPKAVCTSPNRVICHGIPDDTPLKEGDILNIDVSLSKDGVFADTCKMFFIGTPSIQAKRIVQCAQDALYHSLALVAPGTSLRAIGSSIQKTAQKYGFSVVRDFCGHGIGTELHTEPSILHYDHPPYANYLLVPGMTFTIEPMINVGKPQVKILPDGWTAVTRDRSLSAQYEHTLLVTETGVEILTLRAEERALLAQYPNIALPAETS